MLGAGLLGRARMGDCAGSTVSPTGASGSESAGGTRGVACRLFALFSAAVRGSVMIRLASRRMD